MTSGMTPEPESSWPRILRTLSFWALLIVGSIALVQFSANRRPEALVISYNRFAQELERGNIAAVEITKRGQVRGNFKNPVTFGPRAIEDFTMNLLIFGLLVFMLRRQRKA